MADNDFSGLWHVTHTYPSFDDAGEEKTEHDMRATQQGDEMVLETQPDGGSYMLLRLKIENRLATGSWHETTEVGGRYKGMTYSGAGQMLVSKDGNEMSGQWAGVGVDRAANEPKIYTGTWEMKRLQ